MSFRKRNVVVASLGRTAASSNAEKLSVPGIRPSPIDGRLTTSTGTRSLDKLLAGHAGLATGTSLLVEEEGTTDFGGALLRYYAAEGVIQGHLVHVIGMNEAWGRELPGLLGVPDKKSLPTDKGISNDRMKIAWRYERLGEFGNAAGRDRNAAQASSHTSDVAAKSVFCHEFDLSKRLVLPSPSPLKFVPTTRPPNVDFKPMDVALNPFTVFLIHLKSQLATLPPTSIHRVVIPNLLSPANFPISASAPGHLLQFLHALRALLRQFPTQLTAMITLPLSLHPRTTGLIRWVELLCDGVIELAPFPANSIPAQSASPLGAAPLQEELPQGIMKVHRLPIFHEKGGGGGESSGLSDDLAFSLSRRKGLVIKPFNLPPVEGDEEGQQGALEGEHGRATKVDVEF